LFFGVLKILGFSFLIPLTTMSYFIMPERKGPILKGKRIKVYMREANKLQIIGTYMGRKNGNIIIKTDWGIFEYSQTDYYIEETAETKSN
jgi:hypothetical protein